MRHGTRATRRLVLATAGALLLPRAVDAQGAKRRRIAFLNLGSRASAEAYFGVLRQRLRALGYRDEDIEIEIGESCFSLPRALRLHRLSEPARMKLCGASR